MSSHSPRRIAIVGAGPAGTTLAIGLLHDGHEVTLVSDRTPEEIRTGSVMSSQVTFQSALEVEDALGINRLFPVAPALDRLAFSAEDPTTGEVLGFSARFPSPARSIDQRVRVPLLMEEVERLGGKVAVDSVGLEELEELAADHDLVVVSTGRGGLTSLFDVDAERSPYAAPQRVASLTYLRGVAPDPAGPALRYHRVEGVGECFTCPALTTTGPCDIFVVEGAVGGPLDCWDGTDPDQHAERLERVLAEHFPAERARLRDGWGLVDERAFLHGAISPVVRRPVGVLPSGRPVLGMADVVVLNDPLTSQGSNNAIKSAAFYREAVQAHDGPLDAAWMERTFENFWRGWAQWATVWTNSWLRPFTDHQRELLSAATARSGVAERIAAGFDDARLFSPWWFSAEAAASFLADDAAEESSRFDVRELRRALGQYATGVTVVTTADADGRRWGMTANSFTSVSLHPPLVLWAAAKSSPSMPAFDAATHFAVNVLASDQHHLSRQFSVSGAEKFEGVALVPADELAPGTTDAGHPPVLDGTVAHFVCRRTDRVDAGDHVVFFGEIESYAAPGGQPLVFHAGSYRVATKHPDL
jgi:flavin reductase (DIM6/NTAB) family NADH-FMN oxidoreductase RutF